MNVQTTVHEAAQRTFTAPAILSPAGEKAACRAALQLARGSNAGWEHYAGLVVYLADGRGGATRLRKSDEGRTLDERVIPARRA